MNYRLQRLYKEKDNSRGVGVMEGKREVYEFFLLHIFSTDNYCVFILRTGHFKLGVHFSPKHIDKKSLVRSEERPLTDPDPYSTYKVIPDADPNPTFQPDPDLDRRRCQEKRKKFLQRTKLRIKNI
jgi:hypothetical protein